MAAERRNWLAKPAHLVRAARHYEGAAQILIRHAVMTARQVCDSCIHLRNDKMTAVTIIMLTVLIGLYSL